MLSDLFSSIASMFEDQPPEVIRYAVPNRLVFQSWVRKLAAFYHADIEWDADGDAAFGVNVRGDVRVVIVSLVDERIVIVTPSNMKFAPGRCPRDVAEYLARRNHTLEYADWDIINTQKHSYFALKGDGRMHQMHVGVVQAAIDAMLKEALSLDLALIEQGYGH